MTSISESELELEPIKQGGGRAKKGRANLTIKAETKMWSNLVKGPKEDESETVDPIENICSLGRIGGESGGR